MPVPMQTPSTGQDFRSWDGDEGSRRIMSDFKLLLNAWFNTPNYREERRFLETHLELLVPECEHLLHNLIAQHSRHLELARELHNHVDVLHDAYTRGGTVQAVREAYIDRYGGFVLDVPPWLEEVEQHIDEFDELEAAEQTTEALTSLLRKTIARAKRDRNAVPEVVAELQSRLGTALRNRLHRNQARAYEDAIAAYTAALQIYLADRYPHQFATTQNNLGVGYQERIVGDQQDNLKKAIACCETALKVGNLQNRFPEDWATIQNDLGTMYQDYMVGERQDHLEKAITCFEAALQVYTRDVFPEDWATIQHHLGIAYHDRILGERQDNLGHSIACYEDALQIRTREASPEDWAATQNNLGISYLKQAIACQEISLDVHSRSAFSEDYSLSQQSSDDSQERQPYLEKSIVCNEAALQFFTLDTSPKQWASLQYNLGIAYQNRIAGDQCDNLERSIACYEAALQVYTPETFSDEWADTQNNLGTAYLARRLGERRDNLERSIACYEAALLVSTLQTNPEGWANIQYNLGNVYQNRIAGKRRDNMERAIAYYEAALQVHRRDALPLEWAITQHNLGVVYENRIEGEKRANLERAITCYEAALQVHTLDAFPERYAMTQNTLGVVYYKRIAGDKAANLEQAIACYQAALQVHTRDAFPVQWAGIQNNLGMVYEDYFLGDRKANLEKALSHYRAALQVYTREAFPTNYALTHNNLGIVYRERIVGHRDQNLEQAIACYEAALQIYTQEDYPTEYAMIQNNLGVVYGEQSCGQWHAQLEKAASCYRAALHVYTPNTFPAEHRSVQLNLAETEAERGNWHDAHVGYVAAWSAEDLLIALGTGAVGHDAILRDGRDAAARDGFVLTRLGKLEEAIITIERDRARGLAETLALNTADPAMIRDARRRERYIIAHQQLTDAQATLNISFSRGLTESEWRRMYLERVATCSKAQAEFDTVITEIRKAQDPADFLNDPLDLAAILRAAAQCGTGHALVYLVATPWGGVAVAAFSPNPYWNTHGYFTSIDLPELTDTLVREIIETRLSNDMWQIIGGFGHAQVGNGFPVLSEWWQGETLRKRTEALQSVCIAVGKQSTFAEAAQATMAIPELMRLADTPHSELSEDEHVLLSTTFGHFFLRRELQKALGILATKIIHPLVAWLHEHEVSSTTLIPCGWLAAFPLPSIPLSDGHTLGDVLPTSVAPSARSLLRTATNTKQRKGVYALGNPHPTHQELHWGEAEAHTVAKLASQLGLYKEVKVQQRATRRWLVEAMQKGQVVEASCHGRFDLHTPLDSALLLARGERLRLGELLSHKVNLDGLRLLILSACQTAILELREASDEVRSLAAGMVQSGAEAVLATQWAVDDKATYLLVVRFAQEWLPRIDSEPPAAALACAQRWLRTATERDLRTWHATDFRESAVGERRKTESEQLGLDLWEKGVREQIGARGLVAVRGRGYRYEADEAEAIVHTSTWHPNDPDACPYADPIYWAGFQIIGW